MTRTNATRPAARTIRRRVERCMWRLWPHHNLDALLLLVPEDAIHLRRVLQRGAVRDHERRVDLAALDALHQGPRVVVHVRLAHLQREAFGERGADRHRSEEHTSE